MREKTAVLLACAPRAGRLTGAGVAVAPAGTRVLTADLRRDARAETGVCFAQAVDDEEEDLASAAMRPASGSAPSHVP